MTDASTCGAERKRGHVDEIWRCKEVQRETYLRVKLFSTDTHIHIKFTCLETCMHRYLLIFRYQSHVRYLNVGDSGQARTCVHRHTAQSAEATHSILTKMHSLCL